VSDSNCVVVRHVLVDNAASKCDYLRTLVNYATLQYLCGLTPTTEKGGGF